MLKGIDVRQRIEFVSSQDTVEPKTVFVLKPLSSLDMSTLTGDNSLQVYLEKSIVEIKNFETQDVKEAIAMLDPKTFAELISKINEINRFDKAEEKN